ncbi:hypothetical protein OsJ_14215 [Oryza sativa Japonica Group]|uniref:Uncharacterized protein n=1 Tax=Oryza sativa subsp. japonica TaxID=39947 RepID=B9FED0_ORYSJ|nr:hypothetical protein OsJ_14215 [Oryza sativa Japonica Group]
MQMSSGGVGVGGGGGSKVMSPKQVLTVVLVVFCALSFVKLLLLTGSSSPAAAARRGRASAWGNGTDVGDGGLAPKEAALLRSVVAARAPCRLLVFGLSPQLAALAAVNAGKGAATAFVTDRGRGRRQRVPFAPRRLGGVGGGGGQDPPGEVPRRGWGGVAVFSATPEKARLSGFQRGPFPSSGSTWGLLTGCRGKWFTPGGTCLSWTGPTGAAAGEPGRMGAIYTAAALARASAAGGREAVDVAVHDVHRTVERWYAWEYLCEDNLAAAKGRLWHFRVAGGGPPDAFCSTGPAQIFTQIPLPSASPETGAVLEDGDGDRAVGLFIASGAKRLILINEKRQTRQLDLRIKMQHTKGKRGRACNGWEEQRAPAF